MIEKYYLKESFAERIGILDPRHRLSNEVMVCGFCPSGWDTCVYSSGEKYSKQDTYQTLTDWMHAARCYEWDWQNVIPHAVNVEPDIKNVVFDLLKPRLEPFRDKKISALGSFVSKVLNKMDLDHLKIYHPSGRTRQLNDFEVRLDQIRKIHKYLNNY